MVRDKEGLTWRNSKSLHKGDYLCSLLPLDSRTEFDIYSYDKVVSNREFSPSFVYNLTVKGDNTYLLQKIIMLYIIASTQ